MRQLTRANGDLREPSRVGSPARPGSRRWSTAGGIGLAVVAWLAIVAHAEPLGRAWETGREALCYWLPDLARPYLRSEWTSPIAYVYSPAFLQLIAPLKVLPWHLFMAAWTAVLLAALRFLTGPRLFAIGVVAGAMELSGGNISLLLAAAVVLGFRWPAAWAFVLLTKVTPGVALLWFAVRGEWRQLGIALGATALVVAASATIAPAAWSEWIDVLVRASGRGESWAAVPVPFLARLPIALALVTWGARTDRRWTVPVAAMLALPALWYGSLSMLLAVIPLRDAVPRQRPEDQSINSSPLPTPIAVGRAAEPSPRPAAG